MAELTYAQLLETNNLMQTNADETYWLCVTRTVQESKMFPVSPYILLSYAMAFYRYPSLLRKIEASMPAEEIGDRARSMGVRNKNAGMSWGLPNFYLLGREWLINLGLLRPTDAVEDIVYVMDFWKRFQLAYHRNDGHITNKEYGHRAQIAPEREIQVFHSDLHDCEAGDELHVAAQAFLASVSAYGFLNSCESRVGLHNHGPYNLGDNRELIIRDFMDLAESDFPWLDDVAEDIQYNNLTVTMSVKDCHFYLVDDWASFEAEPEFSAEKLVGVGLYTSDILTGTHVPLGMGSREELIETFQKLTAQMQAATDKLWRKLADWSRDQMVDAGALVYFGICKDIAHIAGVYDHNDWGKIDVRAERLRPLLNDEYGNQMLGELVGSVSNPSQAFSEYTMSMHSNAPSKLYTPIPYAILSGEPYTRTSGGLQDGVTNLPEKKDVYTTSKGKMTLAEFNTAAKSFTPYDCEEDTRFLCETWIKYNADSDAATKLYEGAQEHALRIAGKGTGLRRDDITALREQQRTATERQV